MRVLCRHPVAEKSHDISNHMLLFRFFLHRPRPALHVHQANGNLEVCRRLQCIGFLKSHHVINQRCTGFCRLAHDDRFARVDGNRQIDRLAQCFDDRYDPFKLFIRAKLACTRTG